MNLEQFGEELSQARLAKGISLIDISAETRINLKFLEAIESGQFQILPQTYVRAFLKEYSDREIDSPGEPGVSYVGGSGFTKLLPKTFLQSAKLAEFRQTAKDRNISLISRINPHVPEIAIDYEKDVLPLSPSDSATERHIISAYLRKAESVFQDKQDLVNFLSQTLGKSPKETENLLSDRPVLEEAIRAKFAKAYFRIGQGYRWACAPACLIG